MKMKKISNTRWTILALVIIGLIVMFVSGCSMLEDQMNTMKGLVGVGSDPVVIETPACDLSCVEEVKG